MGTTALYQLVAASRGTLEDGRLTLDRTRGDLLLELTALPALRGRVIDAVSRLPLAGVDVDCNVTFQDGRTSPSMNYSCEEDGSFHVPLRSSDPEPLWSGSGPWPTFRTIWLTLRRGGRSASFQFDGSDLESPGDVGTLEMAPGRSLSFVVLDQGGRPIEGATAYAGDYSEPTNADGEGQLHEVGSEVQEVSFGARGFGVIRRSLPRSLEEPLEVELPAANILTIQVASKHSLPDTLEMILSSDPGLFPGSARGSFPRMQRHDNQGLFRSSTVGGRSFELRLHIPEDGQLVLYELKAGQPFEIVLQDRYAGQLWRRKVPGLGAEEERTELFELKFEPTFLRGRVVDAAGVPAAAASVTFSLGKHGTQGKCDAEGRFEFGPLLLRAGTPVELTARRTGDAPSRLSPPRLATPPNPCSSCPNLTTLPSMSSTRRVRQWMGPGRFSRWKAGSSGFHRRNRPGATTSSMTFPQVVPG